MSTIPNPWKHGAMLWLSANVIGTVMLGLYLFFRGDEAFVATILIGFFAAGISLPVIPITVPIFNLVLRTGMKNERIILAFIAVTGLFAVTIGLTAIINTELNLPANTVFMLMAPFYPAGILAAGFEYQKWLFRGDGETINF